MAKKTTTFCKFCGALVGPNIDFCCRFCKLSFKNDKALKKTVAKSRAKTAKKKTTRKRKTR